MGSRSQAGRSEGRVTAKQATPVQPAFTPTDSELARRRETAAAMAREGFSQSYIARKLNVTQPTVCRWLHGTQGFGTSKPHVLEPEKTAAGAGTKPQNGRAPFLTIEQLRKLKGKEQDWTGRK